MFPSQRVSVASYAQRLRTKYAWLLLGLCGIGIGALAFLCSVLETSWSSVAERELRVLRLPTTADLALFVQGPWWVIGCALGAGIVAMAGRKVWRRMLGGSRQTGVSAGPAVMVFLLAALLASTVVAVRLDWQVASGLLIVFGLFEVLVLASAHYVVPLLQNFPRLRRSLLLKVLVVALVVPILWFNIGVDPMNPTGDEGRPDSGLWLLFALAAALAVGWLVRGLLRSWSRRAAARLRPGGASGPGTGPVRPRGGHDHDTHGDRPRSPVGAAVRQERERRQ